MEGQERRMKGDNMRGKLRTEERRYVLPASVLPLCTAPRRWSPLFSSSSSSAAPADPVHTPTGPSDRSAETQTPTWERGGKREGG